MHIASKFALACWALSMPLAASAQTALESYRWLTLGDTLSEVRKTPFQDVMRAGKLVCTGDRNLGSIALAMTQISPSMAKADFKKCGYIDEKGYPTGPDFGDVGAPTLDLLFIPQSPKAAPQLASITAELASGHYSRVVRLLSLRYGPPTKVEAAEVLTKGGVPYQNEAAVWESDRRLARVTRYSRTVEVTKIEIYDSGLLAPLVDLQNKDDAAAARRL